jgi:hypothetical protein
MNIDIFILLFLITLRGIWPTLPVLFGNASGSNRATGIPAVCHGLTGSLSFKAGGSYRQHACSAAGTRRATAPLLVLYVSGFSFTSASVLSILAMDCGTSRGG